MRRAAAALVKEGGQLNVWVYAAALYHIDTRESGRQVLSRWPPLLRIAYGRLQARAWYAFFARLSPERAGRVLRIFSSDGVVGCMKSPSNRFPERHEIRCPLCHSTRAVPRPDLLRIIRSVYVGSTVARCRNCGLSFIAPLPDAASAVYDEDYYRAYTDLGIAMPAEAEFPPERYRTRLTNARPNGRTGFLLDVGPGSGAFLNYARSEGWCVIGIEASSYAAEHAASRYRLDIRSGTLLTAELPDNYFDVVHMSHVLEHVSDPAASLEVAYRVLKPGGSLIIEVPNEFDNMRFRVLKVARLLRPYPVTCTHVFFFTPPTLRGVIEGAGFKVTYLSTFRDLERAFALGWFLRRFAAAIERPLGWAHLIEAVAVKPA